MACRLHPTKRDEYLQLHADVWPDVEATITQCGIRNFTIFVRDNVLFGYFEYIGEDYESDQARMAADPETQRWWSLTDPCQYAFDSESPPGTRWQELDEVWHLD